MDAYFKQDQIQLRPFFARLASDESRKHHYEHRSFGCAYCGPGEWNPSH